ncbi:MAG: pentapeptide repeat-containing protein, partial [Candidatus Aminicenantes bacterium]|nr:pentapeptide repeat-containing protein [Candidatus Aminicenantes bacterium]
IFQLIYTLTGPKTENKKQLVKTWLEHDNVCPFEERILTQIAKDLAFFMADNPRAIKQFCNRFRLESSILKKSIPGYEPIRHIFLQFLQHCFPKAYKLFSERCRIQVLQESKKYFDKFIWEWAEYLESYYPDNYHAAEIDPKYYEQYFPHLPYSPVQRSLIDSYDRFVRVTLNSGREAVVCIEATPKNEKIKDMSNLSDISDLPDTILRYLNLSNCRLDRCNFNGANLEGTDLSSADCSFSNFKNARFTGVTARETIFNNADLTVMDYDGADFEDALYTEDKLADGLKIHIEDYNKPGEPGNRKDDKKG